MQLNFLVISIALIGINAFFACRDNDSGNKTSFRFEDVTRQAGFEYEHGLTEERFERDIIAGGVAAGDFDGDGFIDLYAIRGDIGPNLLFHNKGDGTFEEVGAGTGLDISGARGAGPAFADIEGDGDLDLIIGGITTTVNGEPNVTKPRLFLNLGNGSFEDITDSSGIEINARTTLSAAFGDYDLDGDLDLFLSHWNSRVVTSVESSEHLWKNNGDLTFTDVSIESGIRSSYIGEIDFTFTPTFTDINNDSLPDLLIAGDFNTSKVFLNDGDSTFSNITTPAISDENGMGSAVGDFDLDGDLDWFVSSIYDPNGIAEANWGITGNRLYANNGDGTFEDVTEGAGVRHGFWGWGSCFADFNNDGNLDIFHVNGFGFKEGEENALEFLEDPSRLFISNGDGTFSEMATELGIDDTRQGRGTVCFDYDRDGDIDIFIANYSESPRLYRNEGGNNLNFLNVRLVGTTPNTEAIGARISVKIEDKTQTREIRSGNNFESQNPAEAHFGLNKAKSIDEIRIRWPDGEITVLEEVDPNQFLEISHPLLIIE